MNAKRKMKIDVKKSNRPRHKMSDLNAKLAYAKKQTAYAWAKYYEELEQRHIASVQTYTMNTQEIEQAKELPAHLVREIQEMSEKLKREIECPICMEVIKELKVTGCGHKYCEGCFAKIDVCALCKKKIYKR
jgi:hypothetical protein